MAEHSFDGSMSKGEGTGAPSKEGEGAEPIQRQTQADWVAEGNERFGPDKLTWSFVCPACGHKQTPEDFRQFKDRGSHPEHAADRCVGRYDRSIADCDWAAFGLFGTLGKGRIITLDDGSEKEIFDFATEDHDSSV